MFAENIDFYPTPHEVIEKMLHGVDLDGKTVLEPEAGRGDVVDYMTEQGAKVVACEKDENLRKILDGKCILIGEDFLKLESHQISHIDLIVMNPPFSSGGHHILHAFKIAPPGCYIIALGNMEWIDNPYSKSRKELLAVIQTHGDYENIGECFKYADRKTDVVVALMRIRKPAQNYEQEFEGFFMEDEEEAKTGAGLMPYNAVRDLVNRYVESIKIYDKQLETAVQLDNVMGDYFVDEVDDQDDNRYNKSISISITVTQGGVPVQREEFKKRLQKSGWRWIFKRMNLEKLSTKQLKEDINKFVEQQVKVPFTMRNIYRMIEIVVATTSQRMDKAITEVFEKVASHTHDNKYNLPGYKTNSHYLLTRKFILESYYRDEIEDMTKALCWITGKDYNDIINLDNFIRHKHFILDRNGVFLRKKDSDYVIHHCFNDYDVEKYKRHERELKENPGSKLHTPSKGYGEWFEWGFFRVKRFKKGTYHFEFKNEDDWALFNQHIARIKGYPLPEKKEKTKYQRRQTYEKPVEAMV